MEESPERLVLPATPAGSDAPTLAPDPNAVTFGSAQRASPPGFEIMEELARGGMAVVYKARQTNLQRLVALKMILTGPHASPADVVRFRIEAEAVAHLKHPHIVQIHEVGQHHGCPYIALELLEGGNLAEKLASVPYSPKQAARLVETIARSIHFAHMQGIIHRDLKPGNILLTAEGEPKVTDFGIAKRLDSASDLTMTGAILGTPSYMAPEQAEGKKAVGAAADTYSLGAILYEMLTQRPPFRASTPIDTMMQVLSEEPIAPRKAKPGTPRSLDTICMKCLQKDPRLRYASALELANDLRCYQQGEPITARPPGLLGRLDRWARLRPALAATLIALSLFYAFHLVLIAIGSEGEGGFFHWFSTGLVATWALGATAFQLLSTRSRWRTTATYGWAALDVLMLTLLLGQGDGPRSALLICYHLLIAGTALRFRIALVWFVTGLSILSYIGVVIETCLRRPWIAAGIKEWVIFCLSMLILGYIQHLLLRRAWSTTVSER